MILSVVDISHDREAVEQLLHSATHDGLTGLLARTAFQHELEGALRRVRDGRPGLGLVFVDVDDFKDVNDRHGHAAGDAALAAIASRMADAVRPGDVAGRFGGDEFVVLLTRVHDLDEVASIAGRIQRGCTGSVAFGDEEIPVSVSVGAAYIPGEASPAAALEAADEAMYRAKGSGKSTVATVTVGA